MGKRNPQYTIVSTTHGYNHDVDDILEKAARVPCVGSGFAFFSGGRDLVFNADRKQTAINVVKRLRAAIKKAHVRGRVEVYNETSDKPGPVRLY